MQMIPIALKAKPSLGVLSLLQVCVRFPHLEEVGEDDGEPGRVVLGRIQLGAVQNSVEDVQEELQGELVQEMHLQGAGISCIKATMKPKQTANWKKGLVAITNKADLVQRLEREVDGAARLRQRTVLLADRLHLGHHDVRLGHLLVDLGRLLLERLEVRDDAVVVQDAALGLVERRQQRFLQLPQPQHELTCSAQVLLRVGGNTTQNITCASARVSHPKLDTMVFKQNRHKLIYPEV